MFGNKAYAILLLINNHKTEGCVTRAPGSGIFDGFFLFFGMKVKKNIKDSTKYLVLLYFECIQIESSI